MSDVSDTNRKYSKSDVQCNALTNRKCNGCMEFVRLKTRGRFNI